MKQLINNQRVIETETELLVKRYRKKIGELKAETASYAPETFNVMLKELLDRINAMMTFANDEVRALVIELAMELESVIHESAVKAYQKSLSVSLTESPTVARKKTVKKSRNEATRLAAMGYSNMQVIDAIFGFKTNQYKDGIAGASQNQVAANSRTLSKQTIELEKERKRKENDDIIGYVWVSVLDSRTCIEKNQLVKLADGTEKRIKDIKPGDIVKTHLGTNERVIMAEKTGVKKVIKVTFDDERELIATPDHKIFVENKWVRLDKIKMV